MRVVGRVLEFLGWGLGLENIQYLPRESGIKLFPDPETPKPEARGLSSGFFRNAPDATEQYK